MTTSALNVTGAGKPVMNIPGSRSAESRSARPQVQWSLHWESELRLGDHTELAEFFSAKAMGRPVLLMRSHLRGVEVGPVQGRRSA